MEPRFRFVPMVVSVPQSVNFWLHGRQVVGDFCSVPPYTVAIDEMAPALTDDDLQLLRDRRHWIDTTR